MGGTGNIAAILLCAGKGTRMRDDSRNKVCFDCAGVPVIRRVVQAMRAGGVGRFLAVTGHHAQSVMDALDGESGVTYAYQKEQRGTGHAALCGLSALLETGYSGPVIISAGDRIPAPDVVASVLAAAGRSKASLCAQPLAANPHGGRVMMDGGRVCGIVEFADAAYMLLAGVPAAKRAARLAEIGLSGAKAENVLARAAAAEPPDGIVLAGRRFTAAETLSAPGVNASLYCFADAAEAAEALRRCGSDNAQGEIYITDAIGEFAASGGVECHLAENPEDLLTYSTRQELRRMSRAFMRGAEELRDAVASGAMRSEFARLYGEERAPGQEKRYAALLETFAARHGGGKTVIARAPGRVNLMGRHVEHRGGGVNVFATGCDTVFAVSPRDDDLVCVSNMDGRYPAVSFRIGETLALGSNASWLDYLASPAVKDALAASRGHWSNYVKAAVLRLQMATDLPLCGMNMVCSGEVPPAAGLSSSSSIVVAVAEAVVALNSLNIPEREFVNICGEGEWFVGSRGGAGDHAAIRCGRPGRIVHLDFAPFAPGESVPFSPDYAVIVADSLEQAKKSEGGRHRFNAQVAAYEFAFLLIRRAFPDRPLAVFRDIANVRPFAQIYRMLRAIPETVTRAELLELMPESARKLEELFSTHADPGEYRLRETALYGISECARSARFIDILRDGDYMAVGRMMKTSHDGDRLKNDPVTDAKLDAWAVADMDVSLLSGSYACSTENIDRMCAILDAVPGVLGSELVGAGLGGCVVALVEKGSAQAALDALARDYYGKLGRPPSAAVFTPSCGSSVVF